MFSGKKNRVSGGVKRENSPIEKGKERGR